MMRPAILLLRVFVSAGTFLRRRCLATKGGMQFYRTICVTAIGIHLQTHRLMGGIYEVAVESGSGAMAYMPSFIKIGSGIQKSIHRHRQHGDVIILLLLYNSGFY
jgi:hypothetical protein